MVQDALRIKENITLFLKINGPSLPVHISKKIELSILFTSAFLSELLSEKKIKMSHMRIGSSPLYFLQGQENLIERFAEHLKSKEKDAFILLKEKKFLKDSGQDPAIRVALRSIKDFAVPFSKNDELMWRYFTAPEAEFAEEEKIIKALVEIQPESIQTKNTQKTIFKIPAEIKGKETKKTKDKKPGLKIIKKKTSSKTKEDENFLNKIKEFLSKNSVEIVNIEGLKKDELLLRVKANGSEQLLAAYKKKKISEKEIIKASKKAAELSLSYSILSMGELPKKISELKDALQNIKDIKKIE